MNDVIVYTFSSAKRYLSNDNVFVLQRLKLDLDALQKRIIAHPPKLVIGVGRGRRLGYESVAVNQFNRHSEVIKCGPDQFALNVPPTTLPVNTEAKTSFCNWSAYRLAYFIQENELPTKLSFLHFDPEETDRLALEINRLLDEVAA